MNSINNTDSCKYSIPATAITNNQLCPVTKIPEGRYTLGMLPEGNPLVISSALRVFEEFLTSPEAESFQLVLPSQILGSLDVLESSLTHYRAQRSEGKGMLEHVAHSSTRTFQRVATFVTTQQDVEHTTPLLQQIQTLKQKYQERFASCRTELLRSAVETQAVETRLAESQRITMLYHHCEGRASEILTTTPLTISKKDGYYYYLGTQSIADLLKLYEQALPIQEGYGKIPETLHQKIEQSLTQLQLALTSFCQEYKEEKAQQGWGRAFGSLVKTTTRMATTGSTGEHSKELFSKIETLLQKIRQAPPTLPSSVDGVTPMSFTVMAGREEQ